MYLCSVCGAEIAISTAVCAICLKKYGQCTERWFVEVLRLESERREYIDDLGESETAFSDLLAEEKHLVDNLLYSD